MILGGVHGVVESLFRRFTRQGMRSASVRAGPAAAAGGMWRRRCCCMCCCACVSVLPSPASCLSMPCTATALASLQPLCVAQCVVATSFYLPCSDEEAFKQSVESITGPITRIISRDGMLGVYNQFSDAGEGALAFPH